MISIRSGVNQPIIIAMTVDDIQQVLPYLKYSTYMLTKLSPTNYTESENGRIYKEVMEFLNLRLAGSIGDIPPVGYSETIEDLHRQEHSRRIETASNWLPSDNIHSMYVVVSSETIELFRTSISRDIWNSLIRRLPVRLSAENFPPPKVFSELLDKLYGGVSYISSTSPRYQIWVSMVNSAWATIFPCLYAPPPDTSKWKSSAERVLGWFAADRRTKPETIAAVVKVKI